MRRGSWAAGAVVALVLCATLSGCVPPSSGSRCWPGELAVSPATAQPGDRIEVSAGPVACSISFTDDRWYRVELQYSRWDVVTAVRVRVASDGAFRTTLRVPEGAPPGRPVVAVTAGYTTTCNAGASCAGVTGDVRVARSDFTTPDVRALQARLDAEQTQEGRLTDLGTDRACPTLDRPWTSNLDIDLPPGWRVSGKDVVDDHGAAVARVGDFVRISVVARRTHARLPGCKQDRTVVSVRSLARIPNPPATPPGGRLIVGTSTALDQPETDAVERSGTLVAKRHGDYLCLALETDGGAAQRITLPPGTTARPDGTVLDGSDAVIARPGDRVTALVAPGPVPTPVGCDGGGDRVGVYRLTKTG